VHRSYNYALQHYNTRSPYNNTETFQAYYQILSLTLRLTVFIVWCSCMVLLYLGSWYFMVQLNDLVKIIFWWLLKYTAARNKTEEDG